MYSRNTEIKRDRGIRDALYWEALYFARDRGTRTGSVSLPLRALLTYLNLVTLSLTLTTRSSTFSYWDGKRDVLVRRASRPSN